MPESVCNCTHLAQRRALSVFKIKALLAVVVAGLLVAVTPIMSFAQSQGEERLIDGEMLRDPMQPVSAYRNNRTAIDVLPELPNRSDFTVNFVRAGGSSPVAVINNRSLTVGDELSGMRIMEIRAGEVVLAASGQEYVLTTFGSAVRTPVRTPAGGDSDATTE